DKKNAGNAGGSLKTLADKLGVKSDKPEELAKGIDQLVQAKKEADQRAAAARDESVAAKKEAQNVADARKAAEEKLAKVASRLEAAGVKDEDLGKGIDELASAKASMNQVMQDAAKKLEAAKLLTAHASSERFLKAIDQAIRKASTPTVLSSKP